MSLPKGSRQALAEYELLQSCSLIQIKHDLYALTKFSWISSLPPPPPPQQKKERHLLFNYYLYSLLLLLFIFGREAAFTGELDGKVCIAVHARVYVSIYMCIHHTFTRKIYEWVPCLKYNRLAWTTNGRHSEENGRGNGC